MFIAPMASIDAIKARLKITDSIDDAVLTELALGVSAQIERVAGRSLRRIHQSQEFFAGGHSIIRPAVSPIVSIDWIRESSTRDFETSANYEELVVNEDYVIDAGILGGQLGESGLIRRLNRDFLGTKSSPNQVKIQYTGGYKTDDEAALENGTAIFSSEAEIETYGILHVRALGASSGTSSFVDTSSGIYRMTNTQVSSPPNPTVASDSYLVIRIDTPDIIASWIFISLLFEIGIQVYQPGEGDPLPFLLGTTGDVDPRNSSLSSVVDSVRSGDTIIGNPIGSISANSEVSMDKESVEITDESKLSLIESGVRNGFIGLVLAMDSSSQLPQLSDVGTIENADSEHKPKITLKHRANVADKFAMPADLESACAMQTIHEFQNRTNPGLKSKAARGVSIASGQSISKNPINLLPAVEAIALSYRIGI